MHPCHTPTHLGSEGLGLRILRNSHEPSKESHWELLAQVLPHHRCTANCTGIMLYVIAIPIVDTVNAIDAHVGIKGVDVTSDLGSTRLVVELVETAPELCINITTLCNIDKLLEYREETGTPCVDDLVCLIKDAQECMRLLNQGYPILGCTKKSDARNATLAVQDVLEIILHHVHE